MPGLTQAMVFKYSFQILPMANPAWCVLVLWESWFPSVQKSCVTAEDVTVQLGQPRQEVCVSVVDSSGTEGEGWLFQPLCMVTRLGLSHIPEEYMSEMVGPQLVHPHEHLPPLPAFAGTQGWSAKAPSPLHVDSQESYIIAPWKRRELWKTWNCQKKQLSDNKAVKSFSKPIRLQQGLVGFSVNGYGQGKQRGLEQR